MNITRQQFRQISNMGFNGFTLIEVLLVVAALGIVATLVILQINPLRVFQ